MPNAAEKRMGSELLPAEFVTERVGKKFVMYPGLLHVAHVRGLTSLKAWIVEQPSEKNGQLWIAQAEAILKDPDTGEVQTFGEMGDAGVTNTSRNIAIHAMRMALTRAKARTLRDATDIGFTAVEEMTDDDWANGNGGNGHGDDRDAPEPDRAPRPSRQSGQGNGGGSRDNGPPPMTADERELASLADPQTATRQARPAASPVAEGPAKATEIAAQTAETIKVGEKTYTRAEVEAAYRRRLKEANEAGMGYQAADLPNLPLAKIVDFSAQIKRETEKHKAQGGQGQGQGGGRQS